MANSISKQVCCRCKGDRFEYEGMEGAHIIMPFAIPANSPLDDESIKKYAAMVADFITKTLREHRKTGGARRTASGLILP